jgi:hypothetical protein
MRTYLLVLFLFSLIGSVTELFLLEHTEDFWQLIPFALMLLSVIIIIWNRISQSRSSMVAFRATMVLFILGGLMGIGLHYKGNVEFELEMYPSMKGLDLFWKSIKGATPVLAPGAMTALGFLGLLYTVKDQDLESKNNHKTTKK